MARKKKTEENPEPKTDGDDANASDGGGDDNGGDGDDDKPKEGSVAEKVQRNFTRRQDSLPAPGFARATLPELDEAALEFVTYRDARMEAGEREKAAKKKLRGLVDKYRDQLTNRAGEVVYRFDAADGATQEVLLKPAEVKLTVRKVDPDSSPGSSGDGSGDD